MIADIEDFFSKGCGRCKRFATADCSARLWQRGLTDLRRICLASGLIETVKWGHPCYMHIGRNIAVIGAYRGDYRLSFFNAALMKDPAGVLEKRGSVLWKARKQRRWSRSSCPICGKRWIMHWPA